jgi:small-conductance mechanosensitive channel
MRFVDVIAALPPAVRAAATLTLAVVLGLAGHALLYRGLAHLGKQAPALLVFDGAMLRRTRGPARLLFPLLAVHWALPVLDPVVSPPLLAAWDLVLHLLLIVAVAWLLIGVSFVLEDVVVRRFDVSDDPRARRVRTQVGVLRRVLVMIVALVALSVALMRVEGLRGFGTGLLASAGIIGIIVGIAAQRPIGNLVAGIQLAITQPVRVGDSVVVENEWGTVEEITLTYVVVRVWDARRLVLPISHFFERPFQNWTRQSPQITGTVFWRVDFAAPVAEIRAECERIVRASKHWDGQVWALHVTDATDRTLELRAMMSASNAGAAWELRCEVREKLVDFLRRVHPEWLPRLRVAGWDAQPHGASAAVREALDELPVEDGQR